MIQFAFTQGIAFMNRYMVLQQEVDGTASAEVHYNIARAYHGLGKRAQSGPKVYALITQ
jgi:hypothetical protein